MTIGEAKVLICDDSVLARKHLADILEAFGVKDIKQAANGQAAVDSCKESKPDVVFLDIIMPVKDGITATKEIKEFSPETIVIMCSSVGTQQHLRQAISAGAKDFIQKPIESEKIKQVLNHLFS